MIIQLKKKTGNIVLKRDNRVIKLTQTGRSGPKGDPGEGVPVGGDTGQVLGKASNADYDTEWIDVDGTVTSVNGQTGVVVLDKDDIGLGNVPNVDATQRANHTGTQLASTISDLGAAVSGNTDVAANTAARHTHANKALLDTYAQTEANLADAVAKKHTHPNQSILDNTTASFTTADETKLDGIEAGADVTDATNVAAAGAVMESDTSTAAMGFVVDEDNMISNSATKVPTQQSTKAYVDAQVGSVPSAPVSSVFGRTGAVTAQSGDYTASQVTNTPSGGVAATTVQAAINELDAEKATDSLVAHLAGNETFTGAKTFLANTFRDKGNQLFDIRAYGAVVDGVTDDSAAVRLAQADAETARGKVYFPAGTTLVSGTGVPSDGVFSATNPMTFAGAGMGLSIVKLKASQATDVTGIFRTKTGVATSNVTIQDLTIDGNGVNQTNRIVGFYCGVTPGSATSDTDIRCVNVEIKNCTGYGFDPHERTTRLVLIGCLSHDNSVGSSNYDGFTLDGQYDALVTGCVAYNNPRYSVNLTTSCTNCNITGNIFSGSGITIANGSKYNRVADNLIHDVVGDGIFVNGLANTTVGAIDTTPGGYNTVTGNTIIRAGQHGVQLYGSSYNKVSNNKIIDSSQTTHNTYNQIRVADDGTTFSTNNTVTDNDLTVSGVSNVPSYGIREASASDDSNYYFNNRINGAVTALVSLQGANSLGINFHGGSINVANGTNFTFGTGSGTKFGTSTTDKLSTYGVTPIGQQAATSEIGTVLSNFGIRAAGGTYPLTTSGYVQNTGAIRYGVTDRVAGATLTPGTSGYFQAFDATSGNLTATLTATATSGNVFMIMKTDAGANTVTVNSGSGNTINGSQTYVLSNQYDFVEVQSTTTSGAWRIVRRSTPTLVEDTIVDGVTTKAPSQNAVFDALALKAPLASPALTGVPTAPTASPGTNTTQLATTAYVEASATAIATPDATTSIKGKVQLAGDLGGTASSPIVKPRGYDKVIANVGGDYTVNSSTDVSSTVTTAIAALTSGRTWIETVILRGNFLVDAHIVVPSYTRVILDGTMTTTTLRPSGATNWSNNMGVFELGDRTSKPTTRQSSVVFTPGSKILGDYFNTSASSYPQDKVNSAAGGFVDSTLLNQKDVCGVHSYCTLIDCETVGVSVENMHGAVRFETLGRTNGTPSKGNRIIDTRGRYTIITVEAYTNGYQSDSLEILNTYAENCIDDIVAIIGADGGTVGAAGVMRGVVINGVFGNKNGLRGSGVKLDGGSMLSGLGQVRDIVVSNVNLSTVQASLSGVTPSENLSYLVLMGSTSSKNIQFNNIRGSGNWRFGVRTDTSGIDLGFQGLYVESFYGMVLKSPIVPQDIQRVTLTDCSFRERNYSSAEANSRGIAIMGGAGAQGFKNVVLRNVQILGFEKPYVEEGIAGLGSTGTLTNFDIDIDIRDKAISDMVLSSTNRRMDVRKHGLAIQMENGSVELLTVATPTTSTSAANKAYVDLRALDADVVHDTGTETIAGVKTFSSAPIVPTPSGSTEAANKGYVDGVSSGFVMPQILGTTQNRWYYGGISNGKAATASTVAANTLYALPIVVGQSCTADRMALEVTTLISSSTARAGIYSPGSNMLPDALLLDAGVSAGTFDTSSTGVKLLTISQALTKGLYWIAIVFSHAPGVRAHNTDALIPVLGSVSSFGAAATNGGAVNMSHTYGSLPANFSSTPTYMTAPPLPIVGIRFI